MARINILKPEGRIQVLDSQVPTETPFDTTPLGIAANTVTGLPAAGVRVGKAIGGFAKDVGQGIARTVGSVGITAGNVPTQIANTGLKDKQPLPFDQTIPTAGTPTGDILFGGKPIKTLQQQALEAKAFVKPYIGEKAATLSAPPLVAAGVALDLAGMGGGKAGYKVLIESLQKAGTYETVAGIMKRLGFDDDIIQSYAPILAKEKNAARVEKTILAAEKLHNTTHTAQGAADVIPRGAGALPKPVGALVPDIPPPGGSTITDNFAQEARPGFQKFSRYLDDVVRSGTIHPEDAKILKTIFEGTDDKYLGSIAFDTSGRFKNTYGHTQTVRRAGEVISQTIKLKRGLARLDKSPDFHPSVVLLHEYGHAAFLGVLDSRERMVVEQAFRRQSKAANKALFQKGLAGAEGNSKYYAKNPDEFLAQSFAEYVMQNKVPAETMKPLLQRMAQKFFDGLKRLVTRGDESAIEHLYPIFDKMLAGNKATPLSEFLAKEPTSFRNELRDLLSKGKASGETPPQFEGPIPAAAADKKAAEVAAELPPGSRPPDSLAVAGDDTLKQFTPYEKRVGFFDRFLNTPEFVLQRLGLKREARVIRDSYDNYLAELKPNSDKITAWSKRVSTEGNARIFKFLDGQGGELSAEEAKVAEEVKTWLDEWANRLDIPVEGRISKYITHIFPRGPGGEIPEEIATLIQGKQPGSVYDPFLLERKGVEGFKTDTWAALDAYTKTAARKVNMDPALAELKAAAGKLSNDSQIAYVNEYAQLINMRPSVLDTSIDNDIKKIADWGDKNLGTSFLSKVAARPTRAALATARRVVSAAKLGFSFVSAFKNLTQGVNTFAVLGPKYTAAGYLDMVRNGGKELEEMGVLNLPFVEDRTRSAVKKFWERFDKVTYYNFELTERINRGSAYYGGKAKALAEGATEQQAKEYGKEVARRTQFQFGSIDTPIGMQSELAKTLLQFQTYNVKQVEFVKNMIAQKQYAELARYVAASTVVYGTIGGAFGMSVWNMLPSVNVIGKVPPAFDLANRTYNAVTGQPNKFGQVPDTRARLRDVGNALLTDVVPGGTQINRTIEGLSAVDRGGSFTAPSNANPQGIFQYKIDQTPLNYLRGGLFGKSSLPEAKEYKKKKQGIKIKPVGGRIKVL